MRDEREEEMIYIYIYIERERERDGEYAPNGFGNGLLPAYLDLTDRL